MITRTNTAVRAYRPIVLVATCLFILTTLANAQLPTNRVVFGKQFSGMKALEKKKRTAQSSDEQAALQQKEADRKACVVKYESIAYLFNGDEAAHTIDTNKLKKMITDWNAKLDGQITDPASINPALACQARQSAILISQELLAEKQNKLNAASDDYKIGDESKHSDIDRMDVWLTELGDIAKRFGSVNRIDGVPAFKNKFFPCGNRYQTAKIYQKYSSSFVQFGNNVGLFGWSDKGTISPEVVAFIGGPFRFAFNTIVSATKDNSEQSIAKLQAIAANGGNLVFSMYVPAFHSTSRGTITFAQLSMKFASQTPIFGSPFSPDTLYGSINAGADFSFNVQLPIFNSSSLYIYARPAWIMGTMPYLKSLGRQDNFYIVQSNIGLDIPGVGRLGVLLPTLTNAENLKGNTWLLTLQLTKQIGN